LDLLNKIDEETHKVEDNEDNNIEGEDVSDKTKQMVGINEIYKYKK